MKNFDFNQNYFLENEQVLLSPLELADFEYLKPFSVDEPELWKYSLISAFGEDNLMAYITNAIASRMDNREYPFVVFDKINHSYAGTTRFYDINLPQKTLQLGYTWYGKRFQGTGLNKHCKYLLLEFAFEQLNMERVEFRADNQNLRSIAAMKSIGCTQEGVLRSNTYKSDGTRRDSIVLSILKEEWYQYIKSDLKAKCIK